MTYDDFSDKVTDILKIRLTNYRLTSNDIEFMIDFAYKDIATSIQVDLYRQERVVDKEIDVFDLNVFPVPPIGEEIHVGLLMKIEDEDGLSIDGMFTEVDPYIYKVNKFVDDRVNQEWLNENDGKTITFIREYTPSVKRLDNRMYDMLFSVIVEGIIYYTQDALPNPTGSQSPFPETNQHYQKYEQSKMRLLNKLPQRK